MAVDFIYPSNAELTLIAQDRIARLATNRLGFEIFPQRNVDFAKVMWEQLDNYTGIQNARGLNGEPSSIKKIGSKRWSVEAGQYGEFEPLNENDLIERRIPGSFNMPASLDDLVMPINERLLMRELDRQEKVIWDMATSGLYSVLGPGGVQIITDTFPLQTFTASPGWGTVATATPLADLRFIKTFARGHSVKFDKTARLYANTTTINNVLNNANSADLFGRRTTGMQVGGSITPTNNLNDLNDLLAKDNLPQLVEYDEFWLDDNGAYQLFIPNGKAALVGSRPGGQRVGEYQMIRNAFNPDMAPGPYSMIVDKRQSLGIPVIEVHRGHNGGIAVHYPSAMVILNV